MAELNYKLDPRYVGLTFVQGPKYVGYWIMPGSTEQYMTRFAATEKPRWLTRKMMWYIFEWKWEDATVS